MFLLRLKRVPWQQALADFDTGMETCPTSIGAAVLSATLKAVVFSKAKLERFAVPTTQIGSKPMVQVGEGPDQPYRTERQPGSTETLVLRLDFIDALRMGRPDQVEITLLSHDQTHARSSTSHQPLSPGPLWDRCRS